MKVCIISPAKGAISETFIKAHVNNLPCTVELYYGDTFPIYYGDGNQILKTRSLFDKVIYLLLRILTGKTREEFESRTLAKLLKTGKIDVVLAEYGPTGVAVMDACRIARIPLAVHFHGYDAHADKVITSSYGARYKELFEFSEAIICVSETMKSQLLFLGAPGDKLHLNPYGVDIDKIKITDPSKNPPHFLAVGRLVDKKAPYLTLLAFQSLVKEIDSAKLTLIGDGFLRETVVNLVNALKLQDNVELLGACSHDIVLSRMQESRAFVQHSIKPLCGESKGDSEGTPVGILEASASGLPVISTNHAGIQEAVINNQTGFLVKERDVESMAQAMLDLANDPSLAVEMGKAGRNHIMDNYSLTNSIQQLHQIVAEVVDTSKGFGH